MSLARIFKKTKGRQTFVSDSRWVLPSSFIGLEAEYEGVKSRTLPPHTFADFWQYHEEGSLKDYGAEYVFSTPLFGIDAYNAAEWLTSHAKTSGWKCTKRTGIHVHLDVRDLSIPQLAGMSILYAAVERILYRWVGDGRSSSHFCIPLYCADEALLGVCSVLKAAFQDDREEDGEQALGVSESFQRYAGYNLQALFKFGSIEFRHLQTTHDLNRIVDWVNMLMSLKAAALKLPQSDGAVIRMFEKMEVYELLEYIFGPDLGKKLYTENSKRDFEDIGLPSARDIAVHGCGDTSWISNNSYPKGEHPGFAKWLKTTKKVDPSVNYIDPVRVEEFIPDFDNDIQEQEVAVPQGAAVQEMGIPRGILHPGVAERVFREEPEGRLRRNEDHIRAMAEARRRAQIIPRPVLRPRR